MSIDRVILSFTIATFGILVTWFLLVFCDKVVKTCLVHYYLRQLRAQGRTVLYDDVKSKRGVVLSVEGLESPFGKEFCIQYWWVSFEGDSSTDITLDSSSDIALNKLFAGEALAFEAQKQIARLVRDGLVLMPVVDYRLLHWS